MAPRELTWVRSGPGEARTGIIAALNADWSRLVADPAAGRACAGWSLGAPVFAGALTPDVVLDRIEAAPDQALGVLLAAVRDGDVLAGRVVVQTMLGKMVRMARVDRSATVDDYVAALWCVIGTYPLATRPRRVAANLALDTLKAVRAERRGERGAVLTPAALAEAIEDRRVQPVGLPGLVAGRDGSAEDVEPLTAARVIRSARRQRLVDAATGALLHTVYADGLSGRAAARRHHTSPGSVRVRCSRAVRVLSQYADRLIEAA